MDREWIESIISWIFSYSTIDTTSQYKFGMNGTEGTTTSAQNGYLLPGLVIGTSCFLGGIATAWGNNSSSNDVLYVRTPNDLSHSDVEQKAKDIYDNFDKNHVPQPNEGSTLLVESEEAKRILGEIINEIQLPNIQEGLNVMQKVYKRETPREVN